MRWQESVPAEDYNVLSGVTRSNQKATKSYNALLAPGAKTKPRGHLDIYKYKYMMQVMKHVTFVSGFYYNRISQCTPLTH